MTERETQKAKVLLLIWQFLDVSDNEVDEVGGLQVECRIFERFGFRLNLEKDVFERQPTLIAEAFNAFPKVLRLFKKVENEVSVIQC
jgi:hypothetical protein